jgi:hypothetical protein
MKAKALDASTDVLTNGVATLQALESALMESFPYKSLSEAQAAFETTIKADPNAALVAPNAALQKTIPTTRDAVATMLGHIHAIRTFITLSLPKMEDGNNFGVSIQLDVLKAMADASDKIDKINEEFPKYYSARADALDKLSLAKSTSTQTQTTSTSKGESKGGKEGEEGEKSSSNVSTEEKTTTSGVANALEDGSLSHRISHILALDVQLYAKLELSLRQAVLQYAALLDNVEKNYVKLSMPKGSDEGRHGRGMMF